MNKITRIWNVLTGFFTILLSVFLFAFPDMGYAFAAWIFGCVLAVGGLKQLLYYVSMGIHMVGGRIILYRALITLDLGVFALTIHGTGQRYIMFYFILYFVFNGIISIFRAVEARRFEAGAWKLNLLQGIFEVALAFICLLNNNSEPVMLDMLCLGLVVTALTRIAAAFQKSAIIYIP